MTLCATRSFALLARELASISVALGTIGFLVMTSSLGLFPQTQTGRSGGHVQPFAIFEKKSFTILSSSE